MCVHVLQCTCTFTCECILMFLLLSFNKNSEIFGDILGVDSIITKFNHQSHPRYHDQKAKTCMMNFQSLFIFSVIER